MLALGRRAAPRARDPASSTSCPSDWRRSWCRSCSPSIERLKAPGMTIDHRRAVAQRRARRSPIGRCSSRRARCASKAPRGSCSSATTWPGPCSWAGRRAGDGRRNVDHPPARLRRVVVRARHRAAGHGHRAHLPGDPGHQLRGRQHGAGRRRPARAHGRAVPRPVLARGRHRGWWSAPLYGAVVELVVIRRLFDAPRVIVLVATIGVAQLALAVVTAYPKIGIGEAAYPVAVGQCVAGPRHPGHGSAARDPRRRPRSLAVGAGLVPQPHRDRQDGARRRPRTPTWPASPASAPSCVSTSCGRSAACWPRCR